MQKTCHTRANVLRFEHVFWDAHFFNIFHFTIFLTLKKENEQANNTNAIINIPPYTSKALEEKFPHKKVQSENVVRNTGHYIKKYYKPSPNCMKDYFFDRFPFFFWIAHYDFKGSFVKDLASGITVSLTLN